ncbi:hypothetical protein D3C80_1575290 [compost metagenome]
MFASFGKVPDDRLTPWIAVSYSITRMSVMCAAAAANTSARDLKWWVMAPRETPACLAIFSVVVCV